MDVRVDRTNHFEKDYKKLSKENQAKVVLSVNKMIKDIQEGEKTRLIIAHNLYPPEIDKSLHTLYLSRIDLRLRLIFTIDDDPLMNIKILTLYSIANQDDYARVYKNIAMNLFNLWQEINN